MLATSDCALLIVSGTVKKEATTIAAVFPFPAAVNAILVQVSNCHFVLGVESTRFACTY